MMNRTVRSAFEYHQKGNLKQAEILYKKALKKEPSNFDALHMLGVVSSQRGNHSIAISYIEKALKFNPANAHAYFNLGNVYRDKGQLNKAISCYQKSLELNPNNANAYFSLGMIYQSKGELDEAINCYQKTLLLNSALADVYYNLGIIFQAKGQLDKAASFYQQVIQISPSHADAYNNLGIIQREKGQLNEAISYYQKAIQINPEHAIAYNNLGDAISLKENRRIDDVISCYQKAIELDKYLTDAHYNIGNAYKEENRLIEAIAAYDMALKSNPNYIKALWARCMSQLSVIYPDQSSIQISRELYLKELMNLQSTISLRNPEDIEAAADAVGRHQPFFLAYQGYNDRDLQHLYGELVCRIMSSRHPEFAEHLPMPSCSCGDPLRIGIVSAYFFYHSNWKIPIKGWIENIDSSRFSLYGYHTGKKKDRATELARNCFTRFVKDIYSFEELCRIIRNDNLHVLLYPEIGMDPTTLKLAALRLAPVQCTSWGHPDTSGLPTIDYYLSGDLIEPKDAQEHYTEKLIRLPNLSVYYAPDPVPDAEVSRNMFGLRPKSILYHCCQTLYKYLPKYDEVFPRIAKQAGNCQFLFSSLPEIESIIEQFKTRIFQKFKEFNLDANNYVVFLPALDKDKYTALNKLCDVFLDPIGWSGCTSTLEAIDCNLPVVAFPSPLMRGRESTAILTMMGLKETIAASLDEYVALAVKLGQSSEWRREISEKIARNKHIVYKDKYCITVLEDFLDKSVKERLVSKEHVIVK